MNDGTSATTRAATAPGHCAFATRWGSYAGETAKRDGLIARRKKLRLSQEGLAARLDVAVLSVARVERGEATPRPWRRQPWADALDVTVDELDALLAGAPLPELHEVERVRAATETTLTRGTATPAVLDDIGDLIDHRADECVTAPPAPMLDRLVGDMDDVRRLAADRQPVAALRQLNQFTSQLAALIGIELMVLGQVPDARAWFRVGFSAAAEAEAAALRAHLSAFRATLYLYFGDAAEAARLADGAVRTATGDRGPVSALAPALEAVALAQLGDLAGSEQSRHRARSAFDRMDGDDGTVFGFSGRRLAFYEARALSEAARHQPERPVLDAAFAAQDRALDAYPSDAVGDTTLVSLDRALCLVAGGDAAAGCELAQRVLTRLPEEHRAPIFTDHAQAVARAAGDVGQDLDRWLAQPSSR